MTDEEREAERIKSLASSVYRSLDEARRQEDYVRTLAKKHGDHPAFKTYMREMGLEGRLSEFMSRPQLERA